MGKKRPRSSEPPQESTEDRGHRDAQHHKQKKKQQPQQPPQQEESLEDWVLQLASIHQGQTTSTTITKQERIAKRAAKKARRLERRGGGLKTLPESARPPAQQPPFEDKGPSTGTLQQQQRLRTVAQRVARAVDGLQSQPQHQRAYYTAYSPDWKTHSLQKRRNWDNTGIQPRVKDYGGIGLARDSLWLTWMDMAEGSVFARQLRAEFEEHVPGFFGKKQRTQAAKKQANATMLWKRLLDEKQQQQQQDDKNDGNSKKQKKRGSAHAKLTADEKVEALLKSGVGVV